MAERLGVPGVRVDCFRAGCRERAKVAMDGLAFCDVHVDAAIGVIAESKLEMTRDLRLLAPEPAPEA